MAYVRRRIVRVSPGRRIEEAYDAIAVESLVEVVVNGEPYVTLLASPRMLEELAIGNLLTSGLVDSVEHVKSVRVLGNRVEVEVDRSGLRVAPRRSRGRVVPPSCDALEIPLAPLESATRDFEVDPEAILRAFRDLRGKMPIFEKTGCTHAAALIDREGALVCVAEDVGRHNAVDKVVGMGALKKLDFGRVFMAITGRLTSLVVLKAARIGIPLLASISAPTLGGVEVAGRARVTLVGFARGGRFNVYTHPWRISTLRRSL